MSLLPRTDRASTPRRRETTGGSLGSSTSVRNHTRTRSNGVSSKQYRQNDKDAITGDRVGSKETITYMLEWRINNVTDLTMHVEGHGTSAGETRDGGGSTEREESQSPSEVLRAGRETVDGMYKFDLGVTKDDEDDDLSTRRLSLFLCCAALDSPGFYSNIFIGIISPSTKSGREYASTEYLWSHTQEYEFRPNDDFVRMPLPVLSTLVADPGINPHDAFILCIKIEEVYGTIPRFLPPDQVAVPTDLISALGALIDVPSSADVRFVCLQHQLEEPRRRVSGDSNTSTDSTSGIRSRKRVIYANSQILSHRSPYFADLFTSDFLETSIDKGERYKTIMVDSTDFETVYWMLRFVYTNELLFDESDDHVRDSLQQQSIDPVLGKRLLSSNPSSSRTNIWGWHNLSLEDDGSSTDHDSRSVSSSAHSSHAPPPARSIRSPTAHTASSVAKASPRAKSSTTQDTTISTTISRVVSGTTYPSGRTVGKGPHPTRNVPEPESESGSGSELDPHQHPCETPASAWALSMYILAHRYRLETLADLARGHILAHLTHSTCIPVFLASHLYPDLHERVLDYIHGEWKDVKRDVEFVRCFQEVARGVWGEEGGTILADMVARLPY